MVQGLFYDGIFSSKHKLLKLHKPDTALLFNNIYF